MVSEATVQHCNKFKMCKGCPFVSGLCVAPVGGHDFQKWVDKMENLIKKVTS